MFDQRLEILIEDKQATMDVAFLNSKGFGGNNATASVLSPSIVESMMMNRYGEEKMAAYKDKRAGVRIVAANYDKAATDGDLNVIYNFGTGIIEDHEIEIHQESMQVGNFANSINLNFENPFADMAG